MKRFIFITISAILFLATPVYARMNVGVVGGGGGEVAACATTKDSQTAHTVSVSSIFRNANNRDWYASNFTAGSNYSPCSVTVRIGTRFGSTGTFHVEVWSSNGGSPDLPSSQVGGDSDSVNWSSVSETTISDSDDFNIVFTWSSNAPSLVSGTTYWLVFMPEWAPGNTNYCNIGCRGSETNMGAVYDIDITTWTALDTGRVYYVFKSN